MQQPWNSAETRAKTRGRHEAKVLLQNWNIGKVSHVLGSQRLNLYANPLLHPILFEITF